MLRFVGNPAREKDPAAVALGKRRQASMTPDEQRAFHSAGAKATNTLNAKRSPLERRESARKAARSRRLMPAWLRRSSKQQSAISNRPPSAEAESRKLNAESFARLVDEMPDDAIERVAAALLAEHGAK